MNFVETLVLAAAQCSFKAVCAGTRCLSTGHIVLNGVVTAGPRMGDLVHVDAQLVIEQGVRCSQGTMTITPSDPVQTPACKEPEPPEPGFFVGSPGAGSHKPRPGASRTAPSSTHKL